MSLFWSRLNDHLDLFLLTVHFVVQHGLRDKVEEYAIGDPATVEAKAVCSWIHLAWLWPYRTVICSCGIGDARAKYFCEKLVIVSAYSALSVDVELCLDDFLL